ncbi:hypothetical protein MesoLj113a_58640 [Mesorhizobium sp. 113-1-2]|nr:hypothetical protein MesoLj113a_58640 [Mesorhizobium sp. 113-1-2]
MPWRWRGICAGSAEAAGTSEAGGTAPPSVLPDISPTRGEIGSFNGFATYLTACS